MKKYTIPVVLVFLLSIINTSNAQLVINGGSMTIQSGAVVAVQGDLTSTTDILGAGKILLNGTNSQQVNTNGFAITNLEVSNAANIVLAGNTKVSGSLIFINGRIQTGNNNFILGSTAVVTGASTGKFIETNGTGQLRKEITAAGNVNLPVGSGTNYMPLQYQVSGGTFSANAYVGTQLVSGAHPKKPIRASDFIEAYWKPLYSGITGSTVNVIGTYADGAIVTGSEALLNGLKYDGINWSLSAVPVNTTTNAVTFSNVPPAGNDLYVMNKFLLASAKVFLQGAFDGVTMNDNLRALNLIPLNDPYRAAPYSTFYTQMNNSTAEIAAASVFSNKGTNDNIVDWIFLELRNPSGTLLQTRSALVQKDGDIVDIDGVNPVFFKNLDAANYVVTVRHRNHLGLSSDLTNYQKALSVANPTVGNMYDFTTATDSQIYGNSAAYGTNGALKLMWGGNANFNASTQYTGPSNDRVYLLSTELLGNSSSVISGVYRSGDLNMNGTIRYTGPSNDQVFLLTNVLNANSSTVISQQIIP